MRCGRESGLFFDPPYRADIVAQRCAERDHRVGEQCPDEGRTFGSSPTTMAKPYRRRVLNPLSWAASIMLGQIAKPTAPERPVVNQLGGINASFVFDHRYGVCRFAVRVRR